ncbi:MAG: hypothetical protein KDA44_02345 [Planctomycetales bacterium]|nr:hypothetical protein [Planctomycetales bacterium]
MNPLPVAVNDLQVGDRLCESVYAHDGKLLLAAGTQLEAPLRQHLAAKRVACVLVERDAPLEFNAVAHCAGCGAGLALRPPSSTAMAGLWTCCGCGSIYVAAFDPGCTGLHCGPERVYCDRSACNHMAATHQYSMSPEEFEAARLLSGPMCATAESLYAGRERRGSKRRPLDAEVELLPLDRTYRVVGELISARTRNVSFSGASVVAPRGRRWPAFVVDFTRAGLPQLRLVMQVVHETPSDDESRVIGGRYCGRLDDSVGDLHSLKPTVVDGR